MTPPVMIAIPIDRVQAMLDTLEQVTLLTSDEPQSLTQRVYLELLKWRGEDR
jgi:hypothetical protein